MGVSAVLAYYFLHLYGLWMKPVTTVQCMGEAERSVCTVSHVCYTTNNVSKRHELYALHSTEQYATPLLLGYIIATDLFPQSTIYLLDKKDDCQSTSQTLLPGVSILLYRFKPDNIMHVLHDDVLPVYAVLHKLYPELSAPYPVRLAFADDYGVMPYDELYADLVQESLVYDSLDLCFEEIIVGFDKSTLWYQYGFTKPQGPIAHNASLISDIISGYIGNKKEPSSKQITVFSRQDTRRIINEAELMLSLAREFSISVRLLDLNSHSMSEVIEIMSRSSIVIGMHGALFSSMIWLPENAVVVELFPYAVNPAHYTPYKTLAGIMNLTYLSWVNNDNSKTYGHPDYPTEFGGFLHLPVSEQDKIMAETEVGYHLCCDDPSWLYHIYQDTAVDVGAVLEMLRPVLN
ncbi:protein O-linked-mannose beta-1,4-N-acetylglucosaminyltransferase 2-like [Watersipora subatra]|uniref:protein O-linked-mannose beta-1,4-N-acetylglucosaminyltransferase 2-like n=1 Tax=Watersipora subatra TaxID=2589382 RepID=UPI00355B7252